jgi:hypothetical protein
VQLWVGCTLVTYGRQLQCSMQQRVSSSQCCCIKLCSKSQGWRICPVGCVCPLA